VLEIEVPVQVVFDSLGARKWGSWRGTEVVGAEVDGLEVDGREGVENESESESENEDGNREGGRSGMGLGAEIGSRDRPPPYVRTW